MYRFRICGGVSYGRCNRVRRCVRLGNVERLEHPVAVMVIRWGWLIRATSLRGTSRFPSSPCTCIYLRLKTLHSRHVLRFRGLPEQPAPFEHLTESNAFQRLDANQRKVLVEMKFQKVLQQTAGESHAEINLRMFPPAEDELPDRPRMRLEELTDTVDRMPSSIMLIIGRWNSRQERLSTRDSATEGFGIHTPPIITSLPESAGRDRSWLPENR
jgi:hypothetical protein